MHGAVAAGMVLVALLPAGCREEVTESEASGKKESYVFGIIAKSDNNEVFQAARKGAEDAAKDLSAKHGVKVEILWRTPPEEDAQEQANRLEQLVLSRVDGIGISCSDPNRVTHAINNAIEAGIPTMCWDSDAPDSKRFAFHGIENVEAGGYVMQELAKVMGGKGKVAVLAGNQTATNLQARVRGVREEAAKYPDIEIVDVYYHVETAQDASSKVAQVQTANPDIDGWAMVGGWPLFTDAILKDPLFADGKVKIVAIDALPRMLDYVRQGVAQELLFQQVWLWGYRAVEILFDKAHFDKDPPDGVDISELLPVTKENVEEYAEKWKNWLPN
jgi:ribose transport system substrate-binding protein